MNRRSFRASSSAQLAAVAVATALVCQTSHAYGAEVWLAAVDPRTRQALHWDNSSVDYMDLFRPDAPWETVALQTRIFQIGPGFAQTGAEEDLKAIFADLRRRDIGLALEMGSLTVTAQCPERSEAASIPGTMAGIVDRIKRLGGDLKIFAMDETLVYGMWHKVAGCERSMAEIAHNLAENVAVVRRAFPGVHVGDIEVVDLNRQNIEALQQWPAVYRQVIGEPLAFLHVDVAWSEHAMRNLVPLAKAMDAQHVPFGIIYNGGLPASDDVWAHNAERYFTEIEADLRVTPSAAIFQTWVQSPSHLLPETQRGTLTNIAYRYLLPKSNIRLKRSNSNLIGTLTDDSGHPIAGAPISIEAIDVGGRTSLAVHVVKDVVPPNATTALMGVRINHEGACACSGPTEATIGAVRYHETGSPKANTAYNEDRPNGEPAAKRFEIDSTHTTTINSKGFLVTPGATFTLTVPATVPWDAEDTGYVAIIFQDRDGHGIDRRFWRFRPNQSQLGAVTTDISGSFQFVVHLDQVRLGLAFRVIYEGSNRIRGAIASTIR
jgi:hypothetical protein